MKHIVILLAALPVLTACGDSARNMHSFDGQSYSGRTKGVSRGSVDFVATVRGVSRSLEGAREAAVYEGTKYCITNFGTSDILWTNAPDAEADALAIDRDTLTVTGRCVE